MLFQICGACRHAWLSWDDFVLDPAIRVLGLQVVPVKPDLNLLVFEHACGSSISILATRLRHLMPDPHPGSAPSTVLYGTEQCRGHCRRLEDLETCTAPCANARDRNLILLIQFLRGFRSQE